MKNLTHLFLTFRMINDSLMVHQMKSKTECNYGVNENSYKSTCVNKKQGQVDNYSMGASLITYAPKVW